MNIVRRTWKVNGQTVRVRAPAGRRLLDYLRNEDLGRYQKLIERLGLRR